MFDDPKKELQELEGQLLAAEEEPGSAAEEEPGSAAVEADPPIRNFANGYGRGVPAEPIQPPQEPPVPDEEPRKDPRALVALACAEAVAIAVLAVYWVIRFL